MTQPKTAKQLSKFTPGKWSRIRAYEDKPQLFDIVGGHPATTIVARDIHSSNVTLIAKAPEMYELLETVESYYHDAPDLHPHDWDTIVNLARRIKAAIDEEE